METNYFLKLLKGNNAIRLTDEWILFNDFELYNFSNSKSYYFDKKLNDLMSFNLGKETVKELIERTQEFYNQLDGGRGATANAVMGGGFNHANERGNALTELKFPAEFNVGGKNRSYEKTLKLFTNKYANKDTEYGITVDSDGFVHKHVKGGKSSVNIIGHKGQMILHNHPGGGNFSDSDLISVASTHEKGIVAVGNKKIYTLTKSKNFKANEFIKAVKTAKWPAMYKYDDGADWWLRKNAKTFGYSYTARKS